MTNKSSINPQIFFTFCAFILSGSFIFNPIHSSDNIIISFISAFITAFIVLALTLRFNRIYRKTKSKAFRGFTSISASAISVFVCILLLTETVKDVAYVSGRNITLFYYLFISVAILFVGFYLTSRGENGVFRFCIITFMTMLSVIPITLLSFITTKSVVFDLNFISSQAIQSSIKTGVLTGLCLSIDSTVYINCFKDLLTKNPEKTLKKSLFFAFTFSFILIGIYNIATVLIFGTDLTKSISDPDYALIKLVPGIDLTEIISALRIISIIIKSSVYFLLGAKSLKEVFCKAKVSKNIFILCHYLLIPIAITTLCLINDTLEYGAFQYLFYPAVTIMSLLFILNSAFNQKKNE